jgi:hypothetical protein
MGMVAGASDSAGAVSMSATRTDEANAKSSVKKMSDYMAAQKAISFDYDTNLEIVTKGGQARAGKFRRDETELSRQVTRNT